MMLGRITHSLSIYCGRYEITHHKKGVWASKTVTVEGKTIIANHHMLNRNHKLRQMMFKMMGQKYI